jgi:DNA-binding transcriptional LysR family regulator
MSLEGLLGLVELDHANEFSLAHWLEREHDLVARPPPVPLRELEIYMAWHPRFEREPGLLWMRGLLRELANAL